MNRALLLPEKGSPVAALEKSQVAPKTSNVDKRKSVVFEAQG
jgi:hypothetical protein